MMPDTILVIANCSCSDIDSCNDFQYMQLLLQWRELRACMGAIWEADGAIWEVCVPYGSHVHWMGAI
jgi:hypothetical protein